MLFNLIKRQRVHMHSAKPENVLYLRYSVCECVWGGRMGRRVKYRRKGLFALAYGAVFLGLLDRDLKAEASLCLTTHMHLS